MMSHNRGGEGSTDDRLRVGDSDKGGRGPKNKILRTSFMDGSLCFVRRWICNEFLVLVAKPQRSHMNLLSPWRFLCSLSSPAEMKAEGGVHK